MHSFTYWSPTEVVFGREAELQVAEYVKKYGGSRVFLVYGGGSVVRSGLLGRVTAALDQAGLAHQEYPGYRRRKLHRHSKGHRPRRGQP